MSPKRALTGSPIQAYPITYPKTAMNARKAAMSSRLLRLLAAIRSRKVPSKRLSLISVVGNRHGLTLGTGGLEVLPLGEAHRPGEDDGGGPPYFRGVGGAPSA